MNKGVKTVVILITMIAVLAMPVHAGVWAAGNIMLPHGPVFINQPAFAAARIITPGHPLIFAQPAVAVSAAVRAPRLMVAQSPVFVAGSIKAPSLAVQEAPISLSAAVQKPSLPVQETPVGLSVNTQKPSAVFDENTVRIEASASIRPISSNIPEKSADFGIAVDASAPRVFGPVVEETPISVAISASAPQIPSRSFSPVEMPVIGISTNFQPNFGPSPEVSLTIPRRDLPEGAAEGRTVIKLRNLNEEFPQCPCTCRCRST